MNFQKLIEDECNRVNPIVKLTACVTQDHAQQESIGNPLASNQMVENAMIPQSFNMNEIMAQIQGVESQNAAKESSRGAEHFWAADYGNQITRPDPNPFVNMINTPLHGQNEFFGNFHPIADQHFERSLNVPLAPVYLPPSVEQFPNIFEELRLLSSQPQETLIDLKESEEPTILKSEDKVSSKTAYLHYGGLSVEDVTGATDLGVEFTEPENFYNFVENYVIKYNGKIYKKYQPCSIPKSYDFYAICQNPSIRTAKRVSIVDQTEEDNSSFIMPYYEDSTLSACSTLKDLCKDLVKNEQYLDAIKVLEDNLSLFKKDDYPFVYLLADLYIHEHCFYQACQTVFTWLKNDPDYMNIVPPDFAMEDKDDGTIEKEKLKDLLQMFIKAAQRCPIYPDFRVQMALAKLCQVDRDYAKSVDCLLSVLTNIKFDQKSNQFSYLMKCFSNYMALSNVPCQALGALQTLKNLNLDSIDVPTKMGLICLQQKNYKSAFAHFLDVITRLLRDDYQESEDNLLVNSWTRLRLCVELMGRDDLCEMVDQRDLNALRSNISSMA